MSAPLGVSRARTSLAWSRTSLGLLGNGGLLLLRDPLGPLAGGLLAACALALALATALVARRRVGELAGPGAVVAPLGREVVLLGSGVAALSLAVGVAVAVTA